VKGSLIVGTLPGTLLYGAVAEWLWVGIQADTEKGEYYAAIEILYPEEAAAGMLAIAQAMERQKEFPEVFFNTEDGTVNIGVFFRHRNASTGLLKSLAADHVPPAFLSAMKGRTQVMAVGEADISSADIKPFLDLFTHNGSFRLLLAQMQNGQRKSVWGVQLTTVRQGKPSVA